jgi:hypothetical protein
MSKTADSAGTGDLHGADAASMPTGDIAASEKFTIALSEQLLARGRAVLLEGALPSRDDAFCLLAPPFGDGFGATGRFIEIWSKQPLARSYNARQALDKLSVDDDDLNRLRDVLARDLVLAPEAARTFPRGGSGPARHGARVDGERGGGLKAFKPGGLSFAQLW